ncbi:hypothetical protein ABZ805_00760 [Saccharopolyspora sp. NPDC047091]|uniref:hypothetical protein n=1 Tax=Saccharopolyspora sp. NPDC047091 TaxID=3155924 RepID=UPI003403BB4C
MNAPEPTTEQLTAWRNLLDAFAQVSASWDAAVAIDREAGPGEGPASSVPEPLHASFARAAAETSDVLAGIADALGDGERAGTFAEVDRAQRAARDAWSSAHSSSTG